MFEVFRMTIPAPRHRQAVRFGVKGGWLSGSSLWVEAPVHRELNPATPIGTRVLGPAHNP